MADRDQAAASSSGREVSGEGPMISRPDSPAAKVRVTITMEYVPEPESYEYPEGVEELSVAEMAKQDSAVYHDGTVGIQDVLDWGDVLSVDFEEAT